MWTLLHFQSSQAPPCPALHSDLAHSWLWAQPPLCFSGKPSPFLTQVQPSFRAPLQFHRLLNLLSAPQQFLLSLYDAYSIYHKMHPFMKYYIVLIFHCCHILFLVSQVGCWKCMTSLIRMQGKGSCLFTSVLFEHPPNAYSCIQTYLLST